MPINLGGLQDLTDKQVDMAFARNPMNNNEMNLDSMERKRRSQGILSTDAYETEQQKQQNVQTQQATGAAAIAATPFQGLQKNLGSFADRLGAAVAEITQQGGAGGLAVAQQGAYAPTWTGDGYVAAAGVPGITAGADALAGQKAEQIGELQGLVSPYMEGGEFKRFEDVLTNFADTNGDGILDAQERENLNRSFNIVNQIRRMRELPAGPEREALLMQLQSQDRDGLVSGILGAMDDYDALIGESRQGSIVGAGSKEYSVSDLLEMGTDDIAKEIENAALGKDSLFGGQYALNLKRTVDESAANYRAASREDALALNQIQDVAEEWLQEYKDQFEGQRENINKMFMNSVAGIVKDLDKIAETEGNPEWVSRAKQWFLDMAGEKGDFAEALFDMVTSEEGIDPQVRAIFENYLDKTLGGGEGQGTLLRAMRTLSEKGVLELPDEKGIVKRVPLTTNDKMSIAQIATDPELDSQEKQEKIRAIIEIRNSSFFKGLQENQEHIAGLIEGGDLEEASNLFRSSMVNSLQTFRDSFTSSLYETINQGENVPELIANAANEYKETITQSAEMANKRLAKIEADARRDIQEVNALRNQVGKQINLGITQVKSNFMNAVNEGIPYYMPSITKYAQFFNLPTDEGTLQKYAQAYSYLRTLRQLKQTGDYLYTSASGNLKNLDPYIENPTLLFKLEPANLQALISSSNRLDFAGRFEQSESYKSLKNSMDILQRASHSASQAIRDIGQSRLEIANNVEMANKNFATIGKNAARAIFEAAKNGQIVDLGNTLGVTDPSQIAARIKWIENTMSPDSVSVDIGAGMPTYGGGEDRTALQGIDAAIAQEQAAREAAIRKEGLPDLPNEIGSALGKWLGNTFNPAKW